jgi:hypothetical protein
MTEEQWLASDDPFAMLTFLRGKATARKVRLYATASCRRVWHLIDDERSRRAVEVAERFADDLDTEASLCAAHEQAKKAYRTNPDMLAAQSSARFAAVYASEAYGPDAARVCRDTRGDRLEEWRCFDVLCTGCVVQAESRTVEVDPFKRDKAAERTALAAQGALLREIVGNPFRPVSLDPAWLTPTVTDLATAAYEERALPSGELDTARLAVLADALEEAGCENADILGHLRAPGPHVRGCWAVDLLTGRS